MTKNANMEKISQYNAKRAQPKDATPDEQDITSTPREAIRADQQKRDDARQQLAQDLKDKEAAAKAGTPYVDTQPEDAQSDHLQQLTDATTNLIDQVNNRVNPVKDWIARQPTPGGMAAIIIFILFLALVMIPVNENGQTRLFLFWNSLLGRTHMKYRDTMPIGQSQTGSGGYGGGASGDFGTTSSNGFQVQPNTPSPLMHLNLLGLNDA